MRWQPFGNQTFMRKRRLTCEIEIEGIRNVSVKISKLPIETLSDSYISNYLNENLETAIAELVAQMIGDEIKASASVGEKREQVLRQIKNESEKKFRKRVKQSQDLVLPKELIENKLLLKIDLKSVGQSYLENKRKIVFEFMGKFMDAYQKNKSESKAPTKTNIAKQMFRYNANPHLSLKRELKKIGFTFEEILSEIPK